MVFLIEMNGPNFRLFSKINFGNFDTFVVNLMNFIPLFLQLRFESLIVSTLRSLEVLLFKIFRGLNKTGICFSNNVHFCCFMDFCMFLRPIPTKNAVISSKSPTFYQDKSLLSFFKTILNKEVARKLYKKLP